MKLFKANSYFNVIYDRFDKGWVLSALFCLLWVGAFVVAGLFYYSSYQLLDEFNTMCDEFMKVISIVSNVPSNYGEENGQAVYGKLIDYFPSDVQKLINTVDINFEPLRDIFYAIFFIHIVYGISTLIYVVFYDFFTRNRIAIFWKTFFIVAPALFNAVAFGGLYLFLAIWQGALQNTIGQISNLWILNIFDNFNIRDLISGSSTPLNSVVVGAVGFLGLGPDSSGQTGQSQADVDFRIGIFEAIQNAVNWLKDFTTIIHDPETVLDLPTFDIAIGSMACACVIVGLSLGIVLSSVAYPDSAKPVDAKIGTKSEHFLKKQGHKRESVFF